MTSFSQLLSLHHNCHYCFFFFFLIPKALDCPPHSQAPCTPNQSAHYFQTALLDGQSFWSNVSFPLPCKLSEKPSHGTQTLCHVVDTISPSPTNVLSRTKTCVLLFTSHAILFLPFLVLSLYSGTMNPFLPSLAAYSMPTFQLIKIS